ncbi:MAG: dihydroorotase family protein [Pelolinea sp.]|nr:dihydroorotase family protein [Pelolinea sp.]
MAEGTKTTLLLNGEIWQDGSLIKAGVKIVDGKIDEIITDQHLPAEATTVIDVAGKMILPGGVDIHAHIQDGAETFYYGTCSSLKGGITTVLDMPPFKTVTNEIQCKKRIEWGKKEAVADFGLIGGILIDLEDLENLNEIKECGVHLFKIFMLSCPSMELLWKSVQFAARTGMRLVVHMEEPTLLNTVDWNDPLGFVKANPPSAENVAVAHLLEMARSAGAPIHVCHVSSARTAELIDTYKGWGVDVTAETAPHYLLLNENEFYSQPDRVVVTPALRTAEDNRVLWQALEDGVIDAIISDHFLGALPVSSSVRRSAQDAEPGIAGLEVTLPLLYDRGVRAGNISLKRLIETISSKPAALAKIDYRKGKIAEKMDADLLVFDPRESWTVKTLGKNSRISTLPYEGWQLEGRIEKTLVRGKVVWDGKNILCEPGWGDYIPADNKNSKK